MIAKIRIAGTPKIALQHMNLVRFAHNWNVGTMEQWNIGFWETGTLIYWQNRIDKEVNK
jgi:hypothetical protein